MKPLKVWFPAYYTEAHRLEEHGLALVLELEKHGIRCEREFSTDCDLGLCGSIYRSEHVARVTKASSVPIIQYNWDIYPWSLERDPDLWLPYVEELQRAVDVWVPSQCTVLRTKELAGVDAHVIRAPIRPFEVEKLVVNNRYVIDPVRDYPDPNAGWVQKACDALGIRFVAGKTLGWDSYKKAIGECALLVSAQVEASTGSLCLLEGYWHGKPVLLSDSPYHGGVDYFGNKAFYFNHRSFDSLVTQIDRLWSNPPSIAIAEAQKYIQANFTDAVFAKSIADRLWGLV